MNKSQPNNAENIALGKAYFSNYEEIKFIAKKFPYSLPIQALLSKNLKDSNKLDFDKFLKISAVISPDRNWLYNYVNSSQSESLKINKPVDVQEFKNELVIDHQLIYHSSTEIIENNPSIESSTHQNNTKLDSLNKHLNIIESTEDEDIVSEVLETVKDNSIPTKPNIHIADKNIESGTNLTSQNSTNSHFAHATLEKEIMKVAIDKTIQKEVDEIIANEETETNFSETKEAEIIPEGFNFWLNPSKNKLHSREEKLKRIDALIDKFIKSEPRIAAKKVEFYSPVNIAKQSVEFNEDIISETLAKIFEKQGYFDNSIKVYEKLSLKFPEKRTYFATRIEKLKEIVKNIKNTK